VLAHVPPWGRNDETRAAICKMLLAGGATLLEAPPQAAATPGGVGGARGTPAGAAAAPAVDVVVGSDIGRAQYRALVAVWGQPPIQFNWVLDSVSAYTQVPREPKRVKPSDVVAP
jgi:hypothetical protein